MCDCVVCSTHTNSDYIVGALLLRGDSGVVTADSTVPASDEEVEGGFECNYRALSCSS
jgi:hypothetical protein